MEDETPAAENKTPYFSDITLGWWLYAWQRGLDFESRARRREYWFFQLYNTAIMFVLVVPLFVLAARDNSEGPLLLGSMLPLVLFGLIAFIPGLAVTFRRLHDTGRSGWWFLVSFIPYVGGIILLVFTLLDSEPETNAWGPSPK